MKLFSFNSDNNKPESIDDLAARLRAVASEAAKAKPDEKFVCFFLKKTIIIDFYFFKKKPNCSKVKMNY